MSHTLPGVGRDNGRHTPHDVRERERERDGESKGERERERGGRKREREREGGERAYVLVKGKFIQIKRKRNKFPLSLVLT